MIPFVILAIESDDDREFMTQLYLSYNRLMFSEINKILKNTWDTEDVMQTAIEKLIDKLPLLKTMDRKRTINYIIVASRNNAYNFIRENRKSGEFSFEEDFDELDTLEEPSEGIDEMLIRAETIKYVGKVWEDAAPRYKHILDMKYTLEMSTEEIAADLGVGIDSARTILSRARRSVKTRLQRARQFS